MTPALMLSGLFSLSECARGGWLEGRLAAGSGQAGRRGGRQTERQADRQRDRQADRQADREAGRQAETQTGRTATGCLRCPGCDSSFRCRHWPLPALAKAKSSASRPAAQPARGLPEAPRRGPAVPGSGLAGPGPWEQVGHSCSPLSCPLCWPRHPLLGWDQGGRGDEGLPEPKPKHPFTGLGRDLEASLASRSPLSKGFAGGLRLHWPAGAAQPWPPRATCPPKAAGQQGQESKGGRG